MSSGFALREKARPTARSAGLIRRYADQLIPQFKDPENWRRYFTYHGDRIAFDIDYAEQFLKKNDRILEIGGLPYFLTMPLLDISYDVTVIDKHTGEYVPDIINKYNIKSINCDLDTDRISRDDGFFDAVIMNEVFEHLRINLISSLREIKRVLRPGGRLLLSTPNLRSFRGLYNLIWKQEAYCSMGGIYNNYSYLENWQVMGHVREYTPKEVMDFLTAVGFEVEGVIYRGQESGRLWRLANYLTILRPEFRPFFSIVARKPSTAEASMAIVSPHATAARTDAIAH